MSGFATAVDCTGGFDTDGGESLALGSVIVTGCVWVMTIDIGGVGALSLGISTTVEGMVAVGRRATGSGGVGSSARETTTASTAIDGCIFSCFTPSTSGGGRFSMLQEMSSIGFFLPGYFARSSFALSRFFSISLKKARSPLRILRSQWLGGCSMT